MKTKLFFFLERKYRVLISYLLLLLGLLSFTTLHLFILTVTDPTVEHSILGALEVFGYVLLISAIREQWKYKPGSGIVTKIKICNRHAGITKTMEQLIHVWGITFWRINKKEKYRDLTDVIEYTIEYWDKKQERLMKN